jgi:hypothetical protein
MPNAKVALLCASAAAALALPATASAQVVDPGVHFDSGSPAGKEYAIPLAEGRSDAAGTTNQRNGGAIPFGVGIKPPGGKGGGGNGKKPAHGGGGANGSGSARQDDLPGARPGESSEHLAARIASAEAPPSTAVPTLLLALAVLLPAGALALLLMGRGQASRTGRTA